MNLSNPDLPALGDNALGDIRAAVNRLHVSVGLHLKSAKEDAAEAGERLLEAKAALPHGEFKPWVEANCEFSYRQARKYMQVAKAKVASRGHFDACSSIAEVLRMGKDHEPDRGPTRGPTCSDPEEQAWVDEGYQKAMEQAMEWEDTFERWRRRAEKLSEARAKLGDEDKYRQWCKTELNRVFSPEEEAGMRMLLDNPVGFNGLRQAFPFHTMCELGELILYVEEPAQ